MKRLLIIIPGLLLGSTFANASSTLNDKNSGKTFLNWIEDQSNRAIDSQEVVGNLLLSLKDQTETSQQKIIRDYWQKSNVFNYNDPLMAQWLSESLDAFSNSDPIKSYILSKVNFEKLNPSCENDEIISMYSDLKSNPSYTSDLIYLKKMKQKLKKRAFATKMIKNYKNDHLKDLTKDLWPVVKDDLVILKKNPWLFKGKSRLLPELELEMLVRSQLSKRQCKSAENTIKKSPSAGLSVDGLVEIGNKVYKCYRRKGKKQVKQFFDRYANILYQKFSNAGWAAGKLRKAKYMWGAGDFKGSKETIQDVINLTKSKKLNDSLGDAIFLLGEVVQNDGESRKSIHIFDKFRKNHPSHKKYTKALMKLVVLEGSRKNWSKVKSISKELETIGTRLALKKADPSELSFGLFWQSVAMHKLKDLKGAIEIWKKLASNSFSSYYGAVSSYMLEKYDAFSPVRHQVGSTKIFDQKKYYNKFNKSDKKTIDYALNLIHLGYEKSAACELNHLKSKDYTNTQKMFLSSLLYLSHDWLSMVIKFNSIPRSVRKNFPIGVETMMFPKKFDSQITRYAKKLGLEDEFIMAIIRQESIFNPKAKSWAGARGLMQLMPQTARTEAKKIKKDYLEPQERLGLKGLKSSKDKLFDHNVNIALGVHHVKSLFDIYKSPLFVLTSYNASPSATKRWKKNITFDDKLLFIEKIPYKETRSYAKLVFRNYYYYKKLYKPNSSPKLLSQILLGAFPFLEPKIKL